MQDLHSRARGFTLIELSIVLVIIGLLVGGVLVGRDLISAAGVRAQITQMEKFQQAVNTFKAKYNALPGDMNAADAAQFGFAARGAWPGQGDGNGVLEGNYGCAFCNGGFRQTGEPFLFWGDLSKAGLIEGSFTAAGSALLGAPASGTSLPLYLPPARIGQGNYIYVWSGNNADDGSYSAGSPNRFGLSAVSLLGTAGDVTSSPGLTVLQAYNIDRKIDDGLPVYGNVQVHYLLNGNGASYSAICALCDGQVRGGTYAHAASDTSCMDDGNVAGGPMAYSIPWKNGALPNCALSFKFQ